MGALIIGVLGAECTGKTTLCRQLAAACSAIGLRTEVVAETLRVFCDHNGRTPQADEQLAIAQAHTESIEDAARRAQVVLADTTALMTAVYSDIVFGDVGLYAWARKAQERVGLNLVTALDLPWMPDGIQRDGAHVREPVDRLLRLELASAGLPYCVVAGQGEARWKCAWAAVRHALRRIEAPTAVPNWIWACPDCDDASCERHLFTRLADGASPAIASDD